jgi:hypothetical protein
MTEGSVAPFGPAAPSAEAVSRTHSGCPARSKLAVVFVSVAGIGAAGCGSTTGERAGSGALMGAAGGALVGSLSADAGPGH